MRRIPELLAPVGGWEQLKAAVENGADAVYLGGSQFNARMNAGNFDKKQLMEAVAYAHLRGVKVHVTMNTLITDDELPQALEQAFDAYEAGADALIVQNLGLAWMIRQALPEMELHLSTQGTVYNAAGVIEAEKMGFSRVVLAREVSLDQMREITKKTDLDLEVFVHGALCMCYSGQCHLSRVIGGRSGNRGVCAQPCRLPYQIVRQDKSGQETVCSSGTLLSPKDLCAVDCLGMLADLGIASLKIEGRMKSPEYVALATSVYRKYLDEYLENETYKITGEDRFRLNQVFNRGGFSMGYLLGNPGDSLMSGELSKHQGTFLGVVTEKNESKKQIDIFLANDLSLGDGIEVRSTVQRKQKLPGNVVTYLRKEGYSGNCEGKEGETVTVGSIEGACNIGDQVYKITDKKLMAELRATYEGKSGMAEKQLKKRAVRVEFAAKLKQPIRAAFWDLTSDFRVTIETEENCEAALYKALDEETVKRQLDKTGNTLFKISHWNIDLEEGLSIPVSTLNKLRRDGLAELSRLISSPGRSPFSADEKGFRTEQAFSGLKEKSDRAHETKVSVYLHKADLAAVSAAASACMKLPDGGEGEVSRLYVPYALVLNHDEKEIRKAAGQRMEVIPYLPLITIGQHDALIEKNFTKILSAVQGTGIAVGNLGWVRRFAEAGVKVYGDYGLNVYNSADFVRAKELGLSGAVLSHEFDGILPSIHTGGLELEVAVSGPVPLMVSAHCPIGDLREKFENTVENCSLCQKGRYFLKDRKMEKYEILSDTTDCSSKILFGKNENDGRKYRWARKNNADFLRIYGNDKSIFSGNTLP